jgi:hypothetical protein
MTATAMRNRRFTRITDSSTRTRQRKSRRWASQKSPTTKNVRTKT